MATMEFTLDELFFNWAVFPSDKTLGIVKDFIKSIDPDIKVRMSGDKFYCIIGEKLVNFPFFSNPEGNRLIYEFVLDRFGVSINPYLIGILHEVFHIITYDENLARDRDILYYMLQLDFKEERYEEFTRMYFSIPSEFAATEGAVNYYLSHKELCDNFLKEIEL